MVRRLKWAAIASLAFLALAAGFYRWTVSPALVAEETGARLSQSLGLELARPAKVQFSLLPTPTLRMLDVQLRGQDGAVILTAPAARARLAVVPLLLGRFELASATLLQPTIFLNLDSDPFEVGSAISTAIAAKGADRQSTSLGALEVSGGLLRIVSAANKFETLVEDVQGTLNWPRLDDPLSISLRGRWRDEPLSIEASLAKPADLLQGNRSDGQVSVASSVANLRLDGDFARTGQTWFAGSVSADILSAAAVRRMLELPSYSPLPRGHLTLVAKAAAAWRMLTLSDLRLSIIDQNLDGALAITKVADRLLISGTLAANEARLEPILAGTPRLVDAGLAWSDAPLAFRPPSAFDLDLRISASRLTWRGHALTDAAFELINRDQRLTATLVEASAYGGFVKAELSLSPTSSGVAAHVSGSLANADIGALCADFGWRAYSGLGAGQFSFESDGDSAAALARSLRGSATIQLAPGVVDGLSFEEALRRSKRRPIDVFNDMRVGRTVFSQAVATLTVEKGEEGVINASLIGPGVSASLVGTVDIAGRRMSARVTATQANNIGVPAPNGPRLDLDLRGAWSALKITASGSGD